MKRYGSLYSKVYDIENLRLAEEKSRKRKTHTFGVRNFDKDKENLLNEIHLSLKNKAYTPPQYHRRTIYEKKERIIYIMDYFPHRIIQHAIMNLLEPIFMKTFTTDTYACIKGRGINGLRIKMRKALKDFHGTKYCLKIDIHKFYPSIDHSVLKNLLQKLIKDKELLQLIYMYIDSADGLPIGNYLSQWLANFYLSYFDHYIKEIKRIKYYFRYCDDMTFLSSSKKVLHTLLEDIKGYLKEHLNLDLKPNFQIFPVDSRSIDFVGFRFYHTHTLLRKGIKKNFARTIAKIKKYKKPLPIKAFKQRISSWLGWAKYSNSRNLLKTLIPNTYNEKCNFRQEAKAA